uniref:FtsH_ext domain-containing protein n=1 Tax=Parastrongyloides trichosuri TaxID=131310 RepID=A0A0N4ZEK6_PARTI
MINLLRICNVRGCLKLNYLKYSSNIIIYKNNEVNYKGTFLKPALLSINENRFVRTRINEFEGSHNAENDNQEEKKDEKKKMSKEEIDEFKRKVLIGYLLISLSMGCILYFLTFNISKPPDDFKDINWSQVSSNPISFNEFYEKYLPTGEVKNIVILNASNIMIVRLHDGAIINGKAAKQNIISVQYDSNTFNAVQIINLIRDKERSINIKPGEEIPIKAIEGLSMRRIIELAIGLGILTFLLSQYGKLFIKKGIENKKK